MAASQSKAMQHRFYAECMLIADKWVTLPQFFPAKRVLACFTVNDWFVQSIPMLNIMSIRFTYCWYWSTVNSLSDNEMLALRTKCLRRFLNYHIGYYWSLFPGKWYKPNNDWIFSFESKIRQLIWLRFSTLLWLLTVFSKTFSKKDQIT